MNILEKISRKVDRYDPVSAIVLVGSRTKSKEVIADDWDIVVVSTRNDLFNSLQEDDPEFSSVSDDSLRFSIENSQVGIVPLSREAFEERLDKVLRGEVELSYKPWAIGAVAPEGFLAQVVNSRIIRDAQDNLIMNRQKKLLPMPVDVKRSITLNSIEDLNMRHRQLESALRRQDQVSIICIKAHILFLFLRLLTTIEGNYFAGTKHQNTLSFSKTQKLKERLDHLYQQPVDEDWSKQSILLEKNIADCIRSI